MDDGTFSPAKKGANVGKIKKGKGTKIMLMIDGNGTPLSVFTLSANQAEVNALENLVDIRVTKKKPKRMLYDKAAVQSRTHDQLALQPQATRCALRVSRLSLPRVCTTRMPIYNSQGVLKLPLASLSLPEERSSILSGFASLAKPIIIDLTGWRMPSAPTSRSC